MAYSNQHLLSEEVRMRTVPWLEFFHPYKHACEVLWRHESFLSGFFAPLHHHIYPTVTVPVQPKLKILECIFTLLRLVYPSVRDKLETAIRDADRKNKNALGNVQLMFDFFLPVVSVSLLHSYLPRSLDSRLRSRSSNGTCICNLDRLSNHVRCFCDPSGSSLHQTDGVPDLDVVLL